jgi:hypothetical protein
MPILNSFNPSTAVNVGTNTINIPTHGLVGVQGVVYSNGGGASIGGLVNGFKYYVILIDSNNIRLANTEIEARAGTAIDLLSTGSGSTHTITSSNVYPNSAAYYDFFRKFRFIGTGIVDPEGYTIEADNVRDTLTLIGGTNLVFSDPSSGPIDTITINGPDYDIISPTGVTNGASIRLENVGIESQDLKLTSFRGIRIERVAANEIEFESFGVTETDTLHTVTSRGNLTSNDLIINNLIIGKIESIPGVDGVINISVTAGDAFNGDGTLDDPLIFSPDESQRTDAAHTVILYFTTPSPGTLNYVAVYFASAVLTTGYVRLERENPSTLVWETLDYQAGTTERSSYDIENTYAELYAGQVNYRLTFDWTGNTEYVNYRTRITYETEPIAGNELLESSSETKLLTLGAVGGVVNIRGRLEIIDLLETDGLKVYDNNIEGRNSNDDINIRPSGTGRLVVSTDVDIQGGDLTTTQTTFNLLNATATTVNAFGAASTINIGSNSGTLTIGNPTLVGTQTTQNVYNTVATTVNAFGAATTINFGSLVYTGNTIDSSDSSGIIFVPSVTMNSDLTVENDLRVTNDTFLSSNLSVSGNTVISGSLTVGSDIVGQAGLIIDSNAEFTSDVAVNGGDLTTDQTTFNLVNTNATTVNFAGSGTTINIGAASGTTTVNNDLTVTGNLTVNGTTTTLNTTTLDVEDINITIAKGAPNAAAANGAGISVEGASATLLYASSNDSWNFNKLLTASSLQNTPIGTVTRAAGNFTTLDANSTVGLSPANANVTVSPTGTGTVTISPAGALTINPTTASTINNTSVGATTASTGRFTTLQTVDTSTSAYDLTLASTSSTALTVDRTLTFDVINNNRTIKLNGNVDIGGNLTTANSLTTAGNFALTLTTTGSTNVTLPTTGTLATTGNLSQFAATTSSQLAGVISDETGSGALVFGTSPVIGTPDINGGTADSLTGFSLRDTSAAFDLSIVATSSPALSAARTLTIDVENASRTLTLTGNLDIGGNLTTANTFTTSGNFALTLTTTGSTNVTLPTSGTLATTGNLSQFAATTSAQLAGVISDETGSGALVFATSPTITTPSIAAATFGNGNSTSNGDIVVDASAFSLYSWQASFSAARTLQVSNLTAGRMVTIYMRNTNASARVITIQASTTTSGYANVNLSPATPGAASVVSVSLAATSGTAVVKLFNANGSICGALT